MANIETIIMNNSIVKRLIADKNLSEENLKKIYRRLCKMTHPDLEKKDSIEFIQLKEEYEQAKENIANLKIYLTQKKDRTILAEQDVRRMFYASLRHYLAAGLYSVRMRIKPEIKKRNELILREVLYWAKLYKPSFISVFLEYNRAYVRRFTDWKKRDNLYKAQRLFLFGFYDILNFEKGSSPRSRNAARMYFSDSLSVIDILPPTAAGNSVANFARWFLDELETLAERPEGLKNPPADMDGEP